MKEALIGVLGGIFWGIVCIMVPNKKSQTVNSLSSKKKSKRPKKSEKDYEKEKYWIIWNVVHVLLVALVKMSLLICPYNLTHPTLSLILINQTCQDLIGLPLVFLETKLKFLTLWDSSFLTGHAYLVNCYTFYINFPKVEELLPWNEYKVTNQHFADTTLYFILSVDPFALLGI